MRREKAREIMQRRRAEIRRLTFEHYGTACARCGSANRLQLDHVNNDGDQHRVELLAAGLAAGKGGWQFYQYLLLNDFPTDYELQTLCESCNRCKRYGRCS